MVPMVVIMIVSATVSAAVAEAPGIRLADLPVAIASANERSRFLGMHLRQDLTVVTDNLKLARPRQDPYVAARSD
jgi:hypothetical protein